MTRKLLTLVLLLAVFTIFPACGGDDDDDKTEPEAEGELGTFKGYVVDFQSGNNMPNVTITVLDNNTGKPKGDIDSVKSDASGNVVIEGIPKDLEKIGILAQGDRGVDTYQYNLVGNATNEKLWLVSQATYKLAPALAGVELVPGKGIVAGAVYWLDENGEEIIVGCAKVKMNPESGEDRYMGDSGLPTTLEEQPYVNPQNGYFLLANIAPGKAESEAYIGDQLLGSTTLINVADSICIANIYADESFSENPQPADCE